jgi:large conductance mechanosensitive channel
MVEEKTVAVVAGAEKIEDEKKDKKEIIKEKLNNHIRQFHPKTVMQDFRDFLEEYKVLGLAIAVIMGLASNTLVKAMVDNIIMPIVTPFIPGGNWATATLKIGPVVLGWGPALSALIYFFILAWAVFLVVRYGLGKKKMSEVKK